MEKTSLNLKDSIEAALRNNPTIKAFQEYRQAAEFDVSRAYSGYFPKVNLQAGVGLEQWEDSTTRNKAYDQRKDKYYGRSDASMSITQNIWDGSATSSRVGISKAMLESAEYRLIDNAEVLSLDAILAHIEICRQRKLLSLAEINLRNHQSILASQMERQAAGVANLSDVTQTQARVARAESTLTETTASLETAISNYKRLTGLVPPNLEVPEEPNYTFPNLENALAHSMTINSKVLSKRADIDSSYAQKELDKSAFYPRIFLEASPSYSWQTSSSNTDSWGTAFQLRTEWNLYNGGYDRDTLKGNKARIRQGNRELQALRDSLAKEMEDTWSTWRSSRDLHVFYSNAVLYNTQTRDMYLDQFNVGQRSLIDVLDSENELYSTSIQLVTAQMNEIASQYRLLALGGKLLSSFNVNPELLKVATDQDDFTDRDLTGSTVNNHAFIPEE
ncbi:MAG: TolC family outer membrane protein [Deltaproteobacteria bacterium]|nr:TolC family outer membrane protein [Deltaproteobacteria bacterium]